MARLAGFAIATIAASLATVWFLLPLLARGFVRALALVVNACVWFAASLGAGGDAWTIVKTVGRTTAGALLSPQVFVIVGGLVLVGVLALYGLQRLLGSEDRPPTQRAPAGRESSR